MQKILLALDNSKPGLAAQEYAIDLAKRFGAQLTGIAILDTPWMTAAQPEPLGGGAFKMHHDDMIIRQSQHNIEYLIQTFKQLCTQRGIPHQTLETEGFPAVEIERASHEHDLIVIGKTTDFHFKLDEDTDMTVKHVARDNPRPLILTPESFPTSSHIMVAYDGSLHASRALHMFLLLGLGAGNDLHIVCGQKHLDKADVTARRAVKMAQAYGVTAHYHSFQVSGNIPDALLDKAQELQAGMLVMGGFSHNLLHETFFGSCTKTLMKNSPIPIFLHH